MLYYKSILVCLGVFALLLGMLRALAADENMDFPGEDWEEVTPESQGVDSAKLGAAVEYLEENSGRDGVKELVIVRNGRMIWKGSDIDRVHGIWSCTKSFTSTVLGLLIDDGKCTLDTPASKFLPELSHDYPDVTLRHFTTMTSGYRAVGDEPRGAYVHGPSATPFRPHGEPLFEPGTKYAYWDSAMNEFAHVLTRIASSPVEELFRRRIAEPISMDPAAWNWGDFGEVNGTVVNGGAGNYGNHVRISAREMARFGHLFLNRGNWNGKQLLDPAWVGQATSVQVPASTPLGGPLDHGIDGAAFPIDGSGTYGFNWWVNGRKTNGERKWPGVPPETYAASGFNNNDLFVIPEWSMVVVRLGHDQRDRRITDAVYSTFLKKVADAVGE